MSDTVRHEVEVDTRIAAAVEAWRKSGSHVERCLYSVHDAAGDRKRYQGRRSYWTLSDAEAEAKVAEIAEQDPVTYVGAGARRVLEELAQARKARQAAHEALRLVEAEYGGWSRFFLVQGGHIHRSTACHSLHPTTIVGWLPDLSGLTEADAVAEHGAILCTHCFPSAPVEWTNKYELEAEAKKADACPGSGTHDWEKAALAAGQKPRYGRRYQTCPHCNKSVAITTTGKLRSHKPEGA